MKTAAVICELNPFHNGHKYLFDRIKNDCADAVVAIMSGSFTQRGDIAVCDKYQRAKMAIMGGADLVVELPTVFAVSNAQRFANSGVKLAQELCCDYLCFGAENADIDKLSEIASAFDNEQVNSRISSLMNDGEYYPRAVSTAIGELLGTEQANIINQPNNILAIEYIKAAKNTEVLPFAINRTGVLHDSLTPSGNIASASYIRQLILENKPYTQYSPFTVENPAFMNNLETALLYRLKTMSIEEIRSLADVSEGLENRIFECAKKYNSISELLDALKTKRYTHARLRRILIYALLNITQKAQSGSPLYIRVLAMNDKGIAMLRKPKFMPVITRVAQGYKQLDGSAKAMFDIDLKASNVFALGTNDQSKCVDDFSSMIIKV